MLFLTNRLQLHINPPNDAKNLIPGADSWQAVKRTAVCASAPLWSRASLWHSKKDAQTPHFHALLVLFSPQPVVLPMYNPVIPQLSLREATVLSKPWIEERTVHWSQPALFWLPTFSFSIPICLVSWFLSIKKRAKQEPFANVLPLCSQVHNYNSWRQYGWRPKDTTGQLPKLLTKSGCSSWI